MSETEGAPRLTAQTIAEMELGRQRVLEAQRRIDEAQAQATKLPEPEEGIEVVEMKPRARRGVKLERVDVPPPAPTVSEPEPEQPTEGPTGADPLDELLNA